MFRKILIVLLLVYAIASSEKPGHRIRHQRHKDRVQNEPGHNDAHKIRHKRHKDRVQTEAGHTVSPEDGQDTEYEREPLPSVDIEECSDTSADSEEEPSLNFWDSQNFECQCPLLINEVRTASNKTLGNLTNLMFIELLEKCGKKAKTKKIHQLDRYILVIVEFWKSQITETKGFIVKLCHFITAEQLRRIISDDKTQQYFMFTVGSFLTEEGNVHMLFSDDATYQSNTEHIKTPIPLESNAPTAVMLLKFNPDKEAKLRRKLKPGNIVSNTLAKIIKFHLHDMFVYGKSCEEAHSVFLQRLYANYPDSCNNAIFSAEHMDFDNNEKVSSFSRCGQGNTPVASNLFQLTEATPSKPNKCSQNLEPASKESSKSNEKACNTLLNEISMASSKDDKTIIFIEIARVCGLYARIPIKNSLDGFQVLVGVIGESFEILLSSDLKGETFPNSQPDNPKSFYFVIGSDDIENAQRKLNNPRHVQHIFSPLDTNAVPAQSENVVVVMLLYYATKDRKLMKDFTVKSVGKVSPSFSAIQLKENNTAVLKPRIIDMIGYGTHCSQKAHEILNQLSDEMPSDCNDFLFTQQITASITPQSKPSISRCASNNRPYQFLHFQNAIPTPGSINKCLTPSTAEEVSIVYPFNLQGTPIQGTAQKLALNVWSVVIQAKTFPLILEGEPREITSKLTGLSGRTLSTINKRRENNALRTPGKKKNRPCLKQVLVDQFEQMQLKSVITGFYRNNVAPLFNNIYQEFTRIRKENWETQKDFHNKHPTSCTDPPPHEVLSKKVVKKIVKGLGFKYGKIDERAAVICRPDILKLRGEYLDILKKNRLSENPMKLTYLDETWIDPNQRLSKGWMPSKLSDLPLRERSKYTYKCNKVGRGPRLIVLGAATDTGMISESVRLFKVSKADVEQDYHHNIDSKAFMKWFKDLLDTLNQRNEKHLIIMDNASYHSTKLVPKKTDIKKTIYDWIKKYENYEGVQISLPPLDTIRKWELQSMLDTVKRVPSIKNELYEVDKMAAEAGHRVVRLPPYMCELNPIEMVWGDVKARVRKQNVQQNLDLVKEIAEAELRSVNATRWAKFVKHVEKIEEKYWDEDYHLEKVPERLVIPLRNDDDDDDVDEDPYDHYDTTITSVINSVYRDPYEMEQIERLCNGDFLVPVDPVDEPITEEEMFSFLNPATPENRTEDEGTSCSRPVPISRKRLFTGKDDGPVQQFPRVEDGDDLCQLTDDDD